MEGYLFPATYAIVPHETALQILQAMVQRYNVEAQAINLVAAAKAVDLTPDPADHRGVAWPRPKAARSATTRRSPRSSTTASRIGMHLQFDSTVLYGLGKYAVSATIKQTKTPGPYNTYLNAGLPAGPDLQPGRRGDPGHPAPGVTATGCTS